MDGWMDGWMELQFIFTAAQGAEKNILGLRDRKSQDEESYIMRSFIIRTYNRRRMRNMTHVYIIMNWKPAGYKPLRRRHRRKLEYNIKIYLKGDGHEALNYIQIAQVQWQTVLSTVMNICVPQKADNFWIN
jgi:hypothetical protein